MHYHALKTTICNHAWLVVERIARLDALIGDFSKSYPPLIHHLSTTYPPAEEQECSFFDNVFISDEIASFDFMPVSSGARDESTHYFLQKASFRMKNAACVRENK